MNLRLPCAMAALIVLAGSPGSPALAKPIAYADGTTVMAEYGAGSMLELQVFYAPRYFLSAGLGHLVLDSDDDSHRTDITYARLNYLLKRWNMEKAQANVFGWASLGEATARGDDGADGFAGNAGAQFDYETRRIYASLKSEYHRAPDLARRIDTLQLGFAPYPHDYATLATWFLVQARQYSGGAEDGTEVAFLLRLFKRGAWIEAGPTTDGKLQAMFMFNF